MAEKTFSEVIDTFYGGIAEDVRSQNLNYCALSQNFDIWTNPKRLTPFRSVEADETKSFRITLFAYVNATLYGRGKKSDATTAEGKIFQKTVGQSLTSSWAACTTAEDTYTLNGDPSVFVSYHDWLFSNSTLRVFAYDRDGASITDDAIVGISCQTQALVTSDDILLIADITSMYKKDGEGSGPDDLWSEALELPNERQISDFTEYGDLVAIGVHPGGNNPPELGSKVYLWDKVSEDVSQTIDWGNGHLWILENLDGTLIGVSINTYVDEGEIRNKLVVREWSGGTKARVIYELEADAGATMRIGPNYTKVKEESRISFRIRVTIDGTEYIQMATIGRKTSTYPLAFTLGRLIDNSTAVTAINGAWKLGDTWWFSHNSDGSVNRTNNDGAFGDAFYITEKINGSNRTLGGARKTKQLLSAGLSLAPLPANATASLYYRVNATSTWTLIRTYSTTGDLGSMAGTESAGPDFTNYKEMQFKAVSTGGAEITGINWEWRIVGDDVGE